MKTTKTTLRYPLTRAECEKRIADCVANHGENKAKVSFGYRNGGIRSCDGLIAFSFVESPRTPGAFCEIGYCS